MLFINRRKLGQGVGGIPISNYCGSKAVALL